MSIKHFIGFRIIFISCLLISCISFLANAQSFKQTSLQYIVALGDPNASAGAGAEHWGLWKEDPGPRGCSLEGYPQLKQTGVAPAKWQYNDNDWWVEEHGLIMEQPEFPLPEGKYVVTGGREIVSVLTIYPKDNQGSSRWELSNGAKLYDVTHLPCHAARYRPTGNNQSCSPGKLNQSSFPVPPGVAMPSVDGCHKQDYAVLFVIGVAQRN